MIEYLNNHGVQWITVALIATMIAWMFHLQHRLTKAEALADNCSEMLLMLMMQYVKSHQKLAKIQEVSKNEDVD